VTESNVQPFDVDGTDDEQRLGCGIGVFDGMQQELLLLGRDAVAAEASVACSEHTPSLGNVLCQHVVAR
jgi:hypothetical protein